MKISPRLQAWRQKDKHVKKCGNLDLVLGTVVG